MARYLFDTDVLINLLHGDAATVQAMTRVNAGDEALFSVITEAELFAGRPDPDAEAAEPVKALLAAMARVFVDGTVARQAGMYRATYGKNHGTGLPDALIAATAASTGAVLVTENIRHFPMPEIRVMTAAQLLTALAGGDPRKP